MKDEAAKANAALAELRSKTHNGKMYQADDVDYLLALAEAQGRGLGAINPQWLRDQAKLVKGTLDSLTAAQEVAGWAQSVLTALNVGDVKSGSPLHLKLREVMIAYRESRLDASSI